MAALQPRRVRQLEHLSGNGQSKVGWHHEPACSYHELNPLMPSVATRCLPGHLERKLAMLCNKPPEYDPNTKAYMLDFKGRVREASVKNFQVTQRVKARLTLEPS